MIASFSRRQRIDQLPQGSNRASVKQLNSSQSLVSTAKKQRGPALTPRKPTLSLRRIRKTFLAMKQIVAIVKPFRAQAVLEAVGDFEVDTVCVSEAKGYGRQKDRLPLYRGSEYNPVYLPKIEITILADDRISEKIVERIVEIARTGRIGDGKILVFDITLEADF